MNGNYDSLKAVNFSLGQQMEEADGFIKTHPGKAASLYAKAMRIFMTAVCADNNIRFERPRDLTPINMLGACYTYGIISKYEKAVLDDIRYAAHLAEHPELSYKIESSRTLMEKVAAFYDLVAHYYQLPERSWQADAAAIDSYVIEDVLHEFDMQFSYDKLYLAKNAQGRYALIAQYQKGQSPASDEAFTYLCGANLEQLFLKNKSIIVPRRVDTTFDETYVFTKSVVPAGFEPFDMNKIVDYPTKRRMDIVINLCQLVYALHFNKKEAAIGGFTTQDLWLNGCAVCLSGLERSFGTGGYLYENTAERLDAQKKDRESFAQIIRQLLPEYENIPAIFYTVRNILLGSERILMDDVLKVLKKETRHYRGQEWTLADYPRDTEKEEALLFLRTHVEEKEETSGEVTEQQQVLKEAEYKEMFDKIFN